MPGFDGTGPLGQGPRTGRGLGYCTPGLGFRRGYGRGFGRGLGRGRGYRRGFGYGYGVPQRDVIAERQYLEENVLYLEDLKADIEDELAEIKTMLQEQKASEKKE
ncbi:MAG TPA: DUF5320 domain-containing protein [Clostridia bacterium]|jgi:hypothetical protein|nr:DUF5320 domain-containing protein [Clostridia bacterium]